MKRRFVPASLPNDCIIRGVFMDHSINYNNSSRTILVSLFGILALLSDGTLNIKGELMDYRTIRYIMHRHNE